MANRTPERILENNRKSYARNADKRRAEALKYRSDHLEKCRERDRRRLAEHRDEINARRREIRAAHPEKSASSSAQSRKWYAEHPHEARKHGRAHYARNKATIAEKHRQYHLQHIEEDRLRRRKYFADHPERQFLKNAILIMFQSPGVIKDFHSREYIGCSPGFLRNHIESLFKPGMTWGNYGEWHIDHIVPLSWFPFDEDPDLLFVASHWTNLQPLWGKENMSKGNRYAA